MISNDILEYLKTDFLELIIKSSDVGKDYLDDLFQLAKTYNAEIDEIMRGADIKSRETAEGYHNRHDGNVIEAIKEALDVKLNVDIASLM